DNSTPQVSNAEPASASSETSPIDALIGDGVSTPSDSGSAPDPYPETIPVAVEDATSEVPVAQVFRRPQTVLEEIVVTAQKREEDVRAVPIAISVMTGDDLRKAAISSFDDMARLIPNVSFNTDFNSLYMRGIGTAELNIISEQAVSYVLDGVYVSRLDYLKPGFMDVKRIEVLKGPQGTLFGRNATAGVINVTYGEPTEDWESYAALTGGSRNSRKAEAVVSGPLTDDLSFRLAGNLFKEDGHTLNLATGEQMGDKDIKQARAKFRYRLTEFMDVSLGASYFEYLIGVWASSETFVYPGTLRAAITLLDPTFETELDRRGSASRQNSSDGRGMIVPLQFSLDHWDHTFTSITAYTRLDDFQGGDIDGSAADLAELLGYSETNALSQEFRVVSPPGSVEYVGGLFLFKSSFDAELDIPLAVNPGLNTVSGVTLLGPFIGLLGPDFLDPVTSLVLPGGAAANLNGIATVDVKSIGLFGQFTWHVTDSLALLVGGRYSKDARVGTAVLTDEGPVPIWSVLTLGGYSTVKKADDENFSPKVSMTWEPHEAVTLYGTYAKGFRAGSYNIAAFSEADFEFKPEQSTTYEAGVKTTLFDGLVRFNLGGFSTVYEDYQLATFNGFSYNIANAEEVTSKGIESDLTAMVYPGLIVTAAVGYNKGKFVTHTQSGCPTLALESPGGLPPQGIAALPPKQICDLSGQPLFRAPEWTGNLGLNYDIPLFDWPVNFFIGANASYKGFEFMDSDLDPADGQDSYWLYNAHLGLKNSDGRWNIVVHGKNLSDKLIKTFSGDIPLQAGAHGALTNPPRSVSATLQFNF
ncbi:MAG: TonB-dependent receptor, partial [Pseudomonadota bacterium]|nr:TonB-dependent receptor [Pseudomonadota bacterium]